MAKHIERTISNKAFWQINKHLALSIGIRETLLLQHFIDLQSNIFKDADDFFQSYDQIETSLGYSEYHCKKTIKRLKEVGVLRVVKKGMPYKNYYHVLINRVDELLQLDREKSPVKVEIHQTVDNHLTSEVKIIGQDRGKSPVKRGKNHLTYKTINKKELIRKEYNKDIPLKGISYSSSSSIADLDLNKKQIQILNVEGSPLEGEPILRSEYRELKDTVEARFKTIN